MGWFKKQQHEQVRRPYISDNNDSYTFRRSRTLTGSLVGSVSAAAESRAELQSDRLKHHTLKRKRRHLLLYLLASLGFVFGLWALLERFIPSVQVYGQMPTAIASEYKSSIDSYLSANPTERFTFSLRVDALTATLQKQHPEVRQLNIRETSWLKPARIEVSLRQAVASWTIGSNKYFIDEHGVAYSKNYLTEPTLVVEDRTGINPSDAGAVASERMIHYIGRLVALVQRSGYVVEKIELPPLTSREIDVRISGRSYVIKTSLDRDPAGQAADLVAAIKYLEAKQLSPTYADVRVSSRLYYQ